jgi:predicted nuclease of predicted toxin-antitoxin system
LRAAGLEAEDVRDVGLRGHPDDDIAEYAKVRKLVVLTADLGFGNALRFPIGAHPGVVIARFPNEIPAKSVTAALVSALLDIKLDEIRGNVLVVEPGRVRLRKGGP